MINLGGAKVDFKIDGLQDSINKLSAAANAFKKVGTATVEVKKYNRAFVELMKEQNSVIKETIGRATSYATAEKRVTAALKEQLAVARKLSRERSKRFTATSSTPVGGGFSALPGTRGVSSQAAMNTTATSLERMNATFYRTLNNISNVSSRVTAKTISLAKQFTRFAFTADLAATKTNRYKRSVDSAGNATTRFGTKLTNTVNKLSQMSGTGDAWWKRFGGVAAGFWIAYRAINAIEIAISKLTRTFASGVQVMDDFKSGTAVVSGMLALLSSGGKSFTDRFQTFSVVMNETMRESMRLAPTFQLTMNEIAEGYKELAQFGVVVTKDMTEKTLTSIAMIREIAHTVGSSSRQVRQEIQSLFNGQTRVTDQFGRFLKRMPELKAALFGIAKATTDNATKWQMVIDKMYEFRYAIVQSITTVTGQLGVLENSLKIISSMALENSNVYGSWVVWLAHFNKQLFDAEGNLGKMGVKIYSVFYRMWQSISRIPLIISDILNLFGNLSDALSPFRAVIGGVLGTLAKMFLVVSVWKIALGGALGLINLLLSPLRTIFKLFGQILGATLKFAAALFPANMTLFGILAKVSLLTVGLSAWSPILVGFMAVFAKLFDLFGDFFDFIQIKNSVWNRLFNIEEFDRKKKELIDKWESMNLTDIFLDAHKSATDDLISFGADMGKKVVDDLMVMTEYEFDKLMAFAKDKLPNLFKSFGDINFNDMSDDAKAALLEINKYVFNLDNGLGKDGTETEKSIDKWLKLIEDFNTEIKNAPLDQFNRKTNEITNSFSKIGIELDTALKNIPALAPYEKEIRSLMESVAAIRQKEVEAERELYKIAGSRLGLEEKLRRLQVDHANYAIRNLDFYVGQRNIQEELIKAEEAHLQILLKKPQRDDNAIRSQLDTLTKMREEFTALNLQVDKFNRTPIESMKDGIRKFGQEADQMANNFQEASYNTAKESQDVFKSIFFDSMKNELKSAGDYWQAFADIVYNAIADLASQLVSLGLTQIITGSFGPMLGSSIGTSIASAGAGTPASAYGSAYAEAPAQLKFAKGGMITEPVFGYGANSGKSYSFAENGPERVLTNDESMPSSNLNVAVNVVNQTGQPVNAKQGKMTFDGTKWVIDVIMNKMATDPGFRSVMSGR